ncbi:DUF2333 domain-containing protein [Magnetospirillum sp. SS-4]|uniref:DUF2333 domain-containing protein n=1 Tax=Magnetospirillum sp. SS-4 TaxID=2681465 RepID=UPI001383945C|nr:DUF2333 domain-containing protein [Magnetospirillum sp. SS-4]CAA7615875.1 conserved hypothetical protein [Magnetospirillum sp. SS-4]
MIGRLATTARIAVVGLFKVAMGMLRHPSRRAVLWAAAVAVALGFPVAMTVISRIDDTPDFAPAQVAAGRSRAVAVSAALIGRELDVSRWRANDPFFLPGGWLRDMPAFQLGLVGTLARVTAAMAGERGLGFGPNGPDVDLHNAAGLLKYPGTVWKFDTRTSWLPTASAEKQYRNAQRSLDRYSDRLVSGGATIDLRAETLAAVLETMLRDIDDATAAIDHHLAAAGPAMLPDFAAGTVFYGNKGRLYAQSIVARELGRDFEAVLAERRLTESWTRMVGHLAVAASLRPRVVWAGAPDSSLIPSPLTAQGYMALKARMQGAEVLAALNIRKP